MAVQASQLIARASTEGVDTAKSQLQGMGQAARDASSSVGSGGLFGAVTGAVGGIVNFGAQVGMTIFGLKNLASGAVSLANSFLQPAATAETTQLSFETLLHSTKAAHDEMVSLNTYAAGTPMQTQWVDAAAAKILAFGGTTKDVIPEINAIGDSLSGLGKLSDTSLNSIVDIFGKISAQGKLTGGDMMQLSTWGIPAWQALSDAMGKPIPELQKMVSAGVIPADQAIKALEGGMEKTFGGGMAKQANTFTGLMSTLASNWQIAIAALGTPVLKLVEGQLSNIGGILSSSAFQGFATNAGQGIANVFTGIGNAASYVGNIFKSLNLSSFNEAWRDTQVLLQSIETRISRGVAPALSLLKTDADPVAEVIQNLAKGGLSILSNMLWGVESALLEVDREMALGKGPITDFGNGLKQWESPLKNIASLLGGQFIQMFQFAGQEIKQFAGWFQMSLLPALKDAEPGFNNLAHVLLDQAAPAVIKIRANLIDLVEHGIKTFGPIVGDLVPKLVRFEGALSDITSKTLKLLIPETMHAEKALHDFAEGIQTRVAPIIKNFIDNISSGVQTAYTIWKAVWPYLAPILKGVFDEIKGDVQVFWSIVTGLFNIALDILGGNWALAWTDTKKMLGGVLDGMKQAFSGFWEFVTALFAPITSWFHDRWTDMINDFGHVFGGLHDLAVNIFNGVIGAVKWAFNDIIDLVNNVIGGVNSINVAGFGVHINMIPHLEAGTDFFQGGPTWVGEKGPELAYLPRGTRVIPNNQLSQMQGGTSGGAGQPIILQIDGRTFARLYMPYHVGAIRNNVGVRF